MYYTNQYNKLKNGGNEMEYTIIVASEITELKTIVNDFCSYGWEPQGGIFVDPKTKLYCQPAVREIDNGTKEN